mgnify:CR=1 FL=1
MDEVLIIPLVPMAWPRPRRSAHGGVFMPQEYTDWKRRFGSIVLVGLGLRRFSGPIRLSVDAYFPRPDRRPAGVGKSIWDTGLPVKRWARPDADNIFKSVADALQDARIIENDYYVEIGFVRRFYCGLEEIPRIEFCIESIGAL